jgi:hypothetical protein
MQTEKSKPGASGIREVLISQISIENQPVQTVLSTVSAPKGALIFNYQLTKLPYPILNHAVTAT